MITTLYSTTSSYLTPTILFLLLNLVIGTIVFISKSPSEPNDAPTIAKQIARSPSLVLDRLKSFNLKSFNIYSDDIINPYTKPEPEPEPVQVALEEHHINRCQSDTKPAAGEMPEKLSKKMKKSATMKSAFNHFEFDSEEEEILKHRPATTRERIREVDAEVDAKADDFISRFKQQLKLQRLDSIVRYKDMLSRGN